MNPDLQQLTLVFPDELEGAVLDALGAIAPEQPYTLLHATGHGRDFAHASSRERVRGQVGRRALWLVAPAASIEPLLAALREHIHSCDLVWWTLPVHAIGDFS
ncbi:MAG: DUF3240 family protein [Porticoccaceae bacterium]